MTDETRITRIDLWERPNGSVYIEKYPEGWTASTYAVARTENSELTLDEIVAWLQEHGWRVRRWTGGRSGKRGARAWLGRILPVRSRWMIQYAREYYTRNRDLIPAELPLKNIDFAFDY